MNEPWLIRPLTTPVSPGVLVWTGMPANTAPGISPALSG